MVSRDCQQPLTDSNRLMTSYRHILLALLVGILVGAGGFYLLTKGDQQASPTHSQDSTSVLLSTTSVKAETKDNPNDEDLVLSQNYVANINGKKVSVPIVDKGTVSATNQPAVANGNAISQTPQGIKASVEQTIDLTPVLSSLRPAWELGVGYSYVNKNSYVPFSIQRNYKDTKAVEVTVFIDTDRQAKGVMVQHKWLIK